MRDERRGRREEGRGTRDKEQGTRERDEVEGGGKKDEGYF
jgi:hypothetical protein